MKTKWCGALAAAIMLGLMNGAQAADWVPGRPGLTKPTPECLDSAARTFGHPRLALILILAQERGKIGECSAPNKNGTVDCGPSQINEREIYKLGAIIGVSAGEAMRMVRDDGCFNLHVSAFILSQKLKDAGGDYCDALGRYNSATPGIKEEYQRALVAQWRRMFPEAARKQRNPIFPVASGGYCSLPG